MFNTGLVLYYVSEYSKLEIQKIEKVLKPFRQKKEIIPSLFNSEDYIFMIENLPIGTIICRNLSSRENECIVCLPMFSSHVSLPVKRGEIIWFFTNNDKTFLSEVEDSAPLLSIRNYWLSRKIGLKPSEDLNYTHFQRDAIVSNETLENSIFTLPDYESVPLFSSLYRSLLSSSSQTYRNAKNDNDFYPNAIPRWYSKPHELTLQGSNNSLINLTNSKCLSSEHFNKGAIDIVAGRHTIDEYFQKNKNNSVLINEIPSNNEEEISLTLSKNSFLKIKNTENDLENLKNQKLYLDSEVDYIDETSEGKANFYNDASRLYITEFDNLDSNYYDPSWMLDQSVLEISYEENISEPINIISISGDKDIDDNTKVSPFINKNIKRSSISLSEDFLPSVLLKSNDIRIIARKNYQKSEDEILRSGSIRLVKESDEYQNYSHICMENDGQIVIDGKSIMLGNFNKEFDKFLNSSSKDLDDMHGNGSSVLIGYDENLSEPLVLGNSLQNILKELIFINIDLVEQVKKLSEDLINHQHGGVQPGAGNTRSPFELPITQPTTPNANNFSKSAALLTNKSGDANDHEIITKRYDNLQKSLNKMLSRFAKTT